MSNSTESSIIELPSFYVDTAQITRQPFTVQVVLGKLDMAGRAAPALHLTLSPEFCQRLGELLIAAATGSDPEGGRQSRAALGNNGQ